MTGIYRKELAIFCKESAEYFGIQPKDYENMRIKDLMDEAEWFKYLWTK